MEEVAAARKHDDGKLLRARPVEHVGQRHHVVLLAVDHDRVGRHVADRKALDRGADEHHALGRDVLRDARLHERAERESGEHDGERRAAGVVSAAGVREGRERIVGFADAVVEGAFAKRPRHES